MLGRIKNTIIKVVTTTSLFITIYGTKVLAITTPDEDETNELSSIGIKLFFGALAGYAVIQGGLHMYEAFMSHKEDKLQGGFGKSRSDFKEHIVSGIMCFIAASIIYVVYRWTKSLFDIG